MGKAEQEVIARVVSGWRDNLINLTGTNRLLNFNVSKSSAVPVKLPSFDEVLYRIWNMSGLEFLPLREIEDAEESSGLVDSNLALRVESAETLFETHSPAERVQEERRLLGADLDRSKLAKAMRNLSNKSRQTYLDTGLQVLYLALGQLKWSEPEDPKGVKVSPLLLLPVEIRQASRKSAFLLTFDELEPVLNPALNLKLKLMDLPLPEFTEGNPAGIVKYLKVMDSFANGQNGWSVNTDVVLSYFTFHKEAMYQDIQDNISDVLGSELIQALALSSTNHVTEKFLFSPVAEEHIDAIDPAEKSFQVLSADASQRSAIQAASESKTFILDGPPGTGKSQTISNIIANQIALGKKVLFVSEKIAALEVVKNRLDEVGLGSYLLELHSHKATRQTVAKELGYALKTRPTANGHMSESDTERLEADRIALSSYAAAMNRVRASIGMSVHDAIGEVSLLADLPKVRGLPAAVKDLDAKLLSGIQAVSERLASAWRPALEGEGFLWKGVTTDRNLDVELERALSAVRDLQSLYEPYELLASGLGWHGPNSALPISELLDLWSGMHPGTPMGWLTSREWVKIKDSVSKFDQIVNLIRSDQEKLREVAGDAWEAVAAVDIELLPELSLKSIKLLNPGVQHVENAQAGQLSLWIADLNNLNEVLVDLKKNGYLLADELGLLAPNVLSEIQDALTVQELTASEHRPEKSWLKTEVDSEVERGIRRLKNCHTELVKAQQQAEKTYTKNVLELNSEELISRFANVHVGLHKLSGEYRADKKSLREVTQAGITIKAAVIHLIDAKEWMDAIVSLQKAEEKYAALIGSRYDGNSTNWDSLSTALETARQIVKSARTIGLERLMDNAGYGEQPNQKASVIAAQCLTEFRSWKDLVEKVLVPLGCESLEESSIAAIEKWIPAVIERLNQLLKSAISLSNAAKRELNVTQIVTASGFAASLNKYELEFADQSTSFAAHLEEAYEGMDTDRGFLQQKVDWADSIRRKANVGTGESSSKGTNPISAVALRQLTQSVPSHSLSSAFSHWAECRDVILTYFDVESKLEIITVFGDWLDAIERLNSYIADDSGQQEWLTYQETTLDLELMGFESALEDARELKVPAEDIPKIVFREILKPWIDKEMKADKALTVHRHMERDELVKNFARLDSRLVNTNVSKIVEAANQNRPSSNLGQAKTIQSQSELKRGHIPIRQLLGRTDIVSQALKPVFMMSPLSVSQFLDPSIRFDVVIFDEASQVMPEDAINCIYRADSFIIAGDDKQLPPTNFFDSSGFLDNETDDEEEGISAARDFESILSIAKGSGAFTNMTLKWHYRSRNEDLITFSNNRFYESELITFPSSALKGPDVGVEYFHVADGVYARGGARNNIIEARRVADRIEHHFDTRPNKSLGVIALSQAQASAIDLVKEELLDRRPDLEGFFDESRLDGFFVKNLESVQGDERDVMIFSIGYGRDMHGKFTMNFGPMSGENGWRRLNVAVTRARERNEIVASILPGDISVAANRSSNELRRYLDYALRGIAALGLEDTGSLGGEESPFEESVSRWLRSEGYEVTTQVGSSGYRIDMAVNRPGYPGQFVLGIECDGAAYHSSKTARDRDRLREEVLVGLGWRLHRIWGTAWYRSRKDEQSRLRQAVDAALAAPVDGLLPKPQVKNQSRVLVEDIQIPIGEIPIWVEEYVKASVVKPSQRIDPSLPDSVVHLAASVLHIVEVEGPVHVTVVEMRLREGWKINRIGNLIRENMSKAMLKAKVQREGDFLVMKSLDSIAEPLPTRMHSSENRREIGFIHDREIADTAWLITREAVAIDRDELAVTTARYLGFSRMREETKLEILRVIEELVQEKYLLEQGDQLIFNHLA